MAAAKQLVMIASGKSGLFSRRNTMSKDANAETIVRYENFLMIQSVLFRSISESTAASFGSLSLIHINWES